MPRSERGVELGSSHRPERDEPAHPWTRSVQLRDGASLQIPKVVPQLSETPSATRWIGPELGAHNDEIYSGLLGLDTSELDGLRRESII